MVNRKARIFLASTGLSVLLVLPLLAACAKPEPAPAPPPGAAGKPGAPPAAKPREPAEVVFLGATASGASYIISAGIADLINKNSTWVKASVEETIGTADNIMKGADDPKLRKTAIRSVSSPAYFDALEGAKPFPRKYTDIRLAFFQASTNNFIISVNPAVTSKQGLVGRKVAVGQEGGGIRQNAEFMIRDAWGMWDKINIQPLNWPQGIPALLDGLADAMNVVATMGAPGNFEKHPSFEQVMVTRDSYFFGPTRDEIANGNKVARRNFGYANIPAGAFGPRQKTAIDTYVLSNDFYVYADFPDDVLTEVLRIVYENSEKMASYHALGKGMTKQRMGWLSAASSADFVHPAAVKFFKERNIPLVVSGGSDPAAR